MGTLISQQQIFILRRSDKSFEDTFNEVGYLYEDIIEASDILNMSMNLMGKFYKSAFTKFKLKIRSPAAAKWDKGFRVFLSDYLNDYEVLDVYTPIFFNATDLHNRHLPEYRDINKDSRNLMKTLKIQNPKEQDGQFVITHNTEIEHSPLSLNYWHVELVIYDYHKKRVENHTNLSKKAAKYMISHILTSAALSSEPHNIPPISKTSYK